MTREVRPAVVYEVPNRVGQVHHVAPLHEGVVTARHPGASAGIYKPRCLVELETKVAEDYAKFYNHGGGPY